MLPSKVEQDKVEQDKVEQDKAEQAKAEQVKAERAFQDIYRFQRRDWTLQRIGWAGMALFVLAALAGAFGGGPLSTRTVGDPALATLQLERFARYATPATFTVMAGPGLVADGELRITTDRAFFEAYRIESITPEPLRTDASDGSLTFVFGARGPRSTVTFHVEPQEIGSHSGVFRVGERTRLRVDQFVYP